MARPNTPTPRRSRTPPSPDVLRRRSVLAEAGLQHADLREYVEATTGRAVSRQAITGVIAGSFPSSGGWIEEAIVQAVQASLRQMGRQGRAEQVTLKYLGWEEASGSKGTTARTPVAA